MLMGKGSAPSGNTTTTTINPTQQAQLPFLQGAWQSGQNIYNADPTQLAPPSNELIQGYQNLANYGGLFQNAYLPQTGSAYQSAVGGGMGLANSPAAPYFNQFAQGATAPQQQFTGIGQAAQDTGG